MFSKHKLQRAIEAARMTFAPVGLFGFLGYVSTMGLFLQIVSFLAIAASLTAMYQYIDVTPAPGRLLDCGAKECQWHEAANYHASKSPGMPAL
jgi:hypothetical protein